MKGFLIKNSIIFTIAILIFFIVCGQVISPADFYKNFRVSINIAIITLLLLMIFQIGLWINHKSYFEIAVNFPLILTFILASFISKVEFANYLFIGTIIVALLFLQLLIWLILLIIRLSKKHQK